MQWISRLFAPFLDWIQVEITSHCNAECTYCPHSLFGERWESVHMPLDLYKRISVNFPKTGLIHLQGWGEPLLHPHFFELVRIAKSCGCQVGTTTNGVMVREDTADRIVQEGVNIIGFSLAGTDGSQDLIRRGAPLDSVLRGMKRLHEAKACHRQAYPEIHVAYLWLRSQLEAIRGLPALLENRGISQAVVSTLDYVPHPDLEHEVIQARDRDEKALLGGIAMEVIEEGRKRGIDMVFRIAAPFEPPRMCTENVTRALVVSCHGLVTPCVFQNLQPAEHSSPDGSGSSRRSDLAFGNLYEQSLAKIWRSSSYTAFRAAHANGIAPGECESCPKLFSRTLPWKE